MDTRTIIVIVVGIILLAIGIYTKETGGPSAGQ